ncbi:hypothetical protein BC332_21349 [Capsicum chinense]|nr:hypothetical protein BC332_21349 [Capsicum chinense]
MDLVTVLLRHFGEWVSEIRYDNYRVDGIVIHGKTAYHDSMDSISTQLKIDVSLKRIHANDDVDTGDMTIECYDFVEPSELAVVVVGNVESLRIVNVGGEELISDCYNSVVKVNQKYKNKATLVSIMRNYAIKHRLNFISERSDKWRSSSAILSRKFIKFCILGKDNLPMTLLMYLSNSPSVASVYFPIILCNSRKFNKTKINQNMWYASYNSRQEACPPNSSDFNNLVMNRATFATPFKPNDSILDQIDRELLYHEHNKPVPGGWCLGDNVTDKCTLWGDAEVLRPGPGSKRLEKSFVQIFTNGTFRSSQYIYEYSSLKDVNILKIQTLENVFFLPETRKESHEQKYTEDQSPHVVFLLAILIES